MDNSGGRHLDHDDILTRKRFPHELPFVKGIHRSPNEGSVVGIIDVSFFVSQNELVDKVTTGLVI